MGGNPWHLTHSKLEEYTTGLSRRILKEKDVDEPTLGQQVTHIDEVKIFPTVVFNDGNIYVVLLSECDKRFHPRVRIIDDLICCEGEERREKANDMRSRRWCYN